MWDLRWKRTPQSEDEKREVGLLMGLLGQAYIKEVGDRSLWVSGNKKEAFSVKQVRHDIEVRVGATTQQLQFMWSRIAVPKADGFVWRACQGRVPTTAPLAARYITAGDVYVRVVGCKMRLSITCWLLAPTRSWCGGLCDWLKIPAPNYLDLITQMLQYVTDLDMEAKRKKVYYAVFILTLWKIWLRRNDKVFN
ncbi:hypothetical protein HanRHA438_Chr14g0664091 [Helianthus annuus]|nr:hypothetical protein HanIR_Chr14g0708841 [Helianthus annuus]KAJ0854577.1 hypothetical protein HanRHA438_Chr14g0664091 [Helianthus annuus]